MAAKRKTSRFSRRGMLTFCGAGLVFSLVVFLWGSGFSPSGMLPSQTRLDELSRSERQLSAELAALRNEYREMTATQEHYQGEIARYWYIPVNGDPESEVRVVIEAAAAGCDLKLSNIGSVRRSRVAGVVYSIEFDVTSAAPTGKIAAFMAAMAGVRPQIYLKRLELRSDPRQGTDINFSATLRMLGRE